MIELSALPTVTDLTAYATIASTLIATIAIAISIWTGWIQRQHNKLSVRPLPEIQLRDMIGHISVKLINNGTGPLIVKKFTVIDCNNCAHKTLIDLMPPTSSGWTFFVHIMDNRSIAPNGEIILLELNYDPNNSEEKNPATLTRATLRDLKINLIYQSVYGNTLPQYEKELKWFGRLL